MLWREALRAGVDDKDFWDFTWWEASCAIAEKKKGMLTLAWNVARLTMVDPKKYPRKPDDLWVDKSNMEVHELVSALHTLPGSKAAYEKQARSRRKARKAKRTGQG